jgi:hypothetical protein
MAILESIDLQIKNLPHGLPYPLSTGVPFPKAILWNKQYLQIREDGVPITAQFELLKSWSDGSCAVVLVTFIADATKNYVVDITDTLNDVFTPNVTAASLIGDFHIVIEGVTYYATTYDSTKIVTTELQAPVMTITKISGIFTSEGSTQCLSGNLKYIIRIFSYKDQTFNYIEVTCLDDRHCTIAGDGTWSPTGFNASEYAYVVPFSGANYSIGGESENVYTGSVTGTHYIYQTQNLLLVYNSHL